MQVFFKFQFLKISLENILVNYSRDDMVSYVMSHPNKFEELIKLALSDKQAHSSRAAWLLSNCIENNYSRITKHVSEIITSLKKAKGGKQRDLIYVLSKIDLDEEQEGLLFDMCVEIWTKLSNISSVRYNAFLYLVQTANKYPELYREIILLTQDFYLETLSNGIKRVAQKQINSFRKEFNS